MLAIPPPPSLPSLIINISLVCSTWLTLSWNLGPWLRMLDSQHYKSWGWSSLVTILVEADIVRYGYKALGWDLPTYLHLDMQYHTPIIFMQYHDTYNVVNIYTGLWCQDKGLPHVAESQKQGHLKDANPQLEWLTLMGKGNLDPKP